MKIVGVGIGPGDPDLLTLRALNVIKSSDVVVVPTSSRRITYNAVKPYLSDKEVIEFQLPVRGERRVYGDLVDSLKSYNNVAYVTLGDPAFYSSLYRLRQYAEIQQVIPGITSFSWCSSLNRIPIALGKERVLITPSPLLESGADTYVYMKGEVEGGIKCGNGYFTVTIKRSTQGV
ncbi:cobalt-precorrin-2 C(20)-methyltransferase [Metallosphaera tengchongensis]|uniref:Cobalt-precorrin-2 C(20)-methyltransferase n=1 Tax=Metallosphaera tengchongensis TaxID=1532350 RepID=A0A6N0NW89_9CREN|nr:precorrin-2 C(20)-methyltransferase [Metallosphaera tengchongensis]QKR00475.1 cobalt-precorrin-2 C(20)-methyltransferase [Metallosphaera tengchongensis]